MCATTKAAASAISTKLDVALAPWLESLLVLLQCLGIILCTSITLLKASAHKLSAGHSLAHTVECSLPIAAQQTYCWGGWQPLQEMSI